MMLDTERVKNFCGRLNRLRREALICFWNRYSLDLFPQKLSDPQIEHLMRIRHDFPCNLARVMSQTGMSSSGASLLINKLVEARVLIRELDPDDRRNILIDATPETRVVLAAVEKGLSEYICSFMGTLTDEEVETIDKGMEIMCRAMDNTEKK